MELEATEKQKEVKSLLSPLGQFLEYLLAFHASLLSDQERQECDHELAEIVAARWPSPLEEGTPLQSADAIRELWLRRVSFPAGCSEDSIPQGNLPAA